MISKITAVISIIKELIGLYKTFTKWMREREAKAVEDKAQSKINAIKKAKNVKTAKEAFDAQRKIAGIDSKPKS